MNNISTVHNCYGCGVCAAVCSHKIIEIRLNTEGFYEPFILNPSACTECGLCREVCAYLHEELSLSSVVLGSYAAWSRDVQVRHKCSSGGVGFELGKYLQSQGYKVCGVRYNAELCRAEHYIASTPEELIPSIGSKYIQSYTVDAFRSIDRKQRYLITGTPCQIDSFRRYARKFRMEDRFVFMDFFCHGVPSMWVWRKYIAKVEQITGKIFYASWRNKSTGWHDSWAMGIGNENEAEKVDWHDSYNLLIREKKTSYTCRLSQGDAFFTLFLSDSCLGRACYEHCKYKTVRSAADLRIGDLWGSTYAENEEGVSGVLSFTPRGEELLRSCGCFLVPHPVSVVTEGQMKVAPRMTFVRKRLIGLLQQDSLPIDRIVKSCKRYKRLELLRRLLCHPGMAIYRLSTKLRRMR